jgi:Diadenosine tetraphosphate (Ap4A) hydrolase and other HIT family hydrolases
MSAHTDHCTFCDLIQGAAEVSVCHEDADSIAFMDIQPVNSGHILVVPRAHYNSLLDVPPELGMHLFRVTMRLAGAIRKVTGCEDLNIVVNSGAAAGQDEPHYHVHIIPRRHGDGFDINLPFAGSQMPDRTVLDATAVQLIAAMRDPMKWDTADPRGDTATAKTATTTPEMLAAATVEIPASEIARMAAETGEVLDGVERSADGKGGAIELEIVVKVAREGVSSGDPSHRGVWHVEEGAHGELVYDPLEPL